jgi:hypothetical protein
MTRSDRMFAWVAVIAILIALPGASMGAVPASLIGQNLVVNGDAEAGPGLPQKNSTNVPGWTTTGHFTAVNYGFDDYPSTTSPGATDRGKNLFSGGTNDPISTASQSIDVTPLAAPIDRGQITYAFSAWIGGYASQADYAAVGATFYSAAHARLGGVTLGPVTAANRQGLTALLRRAAEGTLPAGTRSIGVKVTATRFEGSSNDGYTDNISLVLSGPSN